MTIITTYHSVKGHEFDTVILPGLLNSILPRNIADQDTWRNPNARELAEQRRSFYVARTRAEHSIHPIIGLSCLTQSGCWIEKGPSSCVIDMARRLQSP